MKVISVVGARPQFIKCAVVDRELRKFHTDVIVHTGQHYDFSMSEMFFSELDIPRPDYNLGVGSGPHGWQTGRMLSGVEEVLLKERPDVVIVYGDTNSTLAGALAASKLGIPLAHVEAGLRSHNRSMPEEINRVLTDHVSDFLFCPCRRAMDNLRFEGITDGVFNSGDVMYDAMLRSLPVAEARSRVLEELGLSKGGYYLATVHRNYNADVEENLINIISALDELDLPTVFPVHPRTAAALERLHLKPRRIRFVDPVGYLDMLVLVKNSRKVLTDSGGLQKEAYLLGVPCVTFREETEWVETLEGGWNFLAVADRGRIVDYTLHHLPSGRKANPYGDGRASERIVEILSGV